MTTCFRCLTHPCMCKRAGPPTPRDEVLLPVPPTGQYDVPPILQPGGPTRTPNPKTLMGAKKLPVLSVIPPAAIAYMGAALRYGAYESPRVDGSFGYGPYNWRDQPIEAMTYIDAAMRHLMEYADGADVDDASKKSHLAHAMASVAILVDAIENNTVIDNRPAVRKGAVSAVIKRETRK